MSAPEKTEIAVVGAGITGAFVAYMLARDGHRVAIVDGLTAPYRATSCNPGGINPLHGPGLPQPMSEFYLYSHRLHADLCEELCTASGMNFGLRVIDRLFLAFSKEERRQLLAMSEDYARAEGFSARWLSADELGRMDKRISGDALGGLFTHGNIIVDCERYCTALRRAAAKLGATEIRQDVLSFKVEDGRVSELELADGRLVCDRLVLAAGYQTGNLCRLLGIELPVRPLKGELLVVRIPGDKLPFDVTRGLSGLYQLRDDTYWLGGTKVDPSGEPEATEGGRRELLAGCKRMLPGLEELEILGHQAGFRPESADKLPIVGPLPAYSNVYVGTGGGSKGVLLSSGIADTLRIMMGRNPEETAPFLAPGRFDVGI